MRERFGGVCEVKAQDCSASSSQSSSSSLMRSSSDNSSTGSSTLIRIMAWEFNERGEEGWVGLARASSSEVLFIGPTRLPCSY